jgi:tetratricopeptide (TPR) repeat protein
VLGPHHWNAVAVVDYFAGFRDKARATFAAIARGDDLYLAHENAASLALEDGQLAAARRELRRALHLLPDQALAGNPPDRALFVKLTRADYYNSLAVIDDAADADAHALRAARVAARLDPTHPEAQYDLALLLMEHGAPAQAIAPLQRAITLDPGFAEAAVLLGVAQQRAGNCRDALRTLDGAATVRRWPRRQYPHAVGEGDFHDAAIVRHRRIPTVPPGMRADDARAACAAGGDAARRGTSS